MASLRELIREPDLAADTEAQMVEIAAIAAHERWVRRMGRADNWQRCSDRVRNDFRDEQRAVIAALRRAGFTVGGGW